MNRRDFLLNSASAMAVSRIPLWARSGVAVATASLVIQPELRQNRIPASFAGLSYEKAQLANPGFFATGNRDLIALFRRLGPGGVLRIGGMTSDNVNWSFQDTPATLSTYYSAYGPEDAMRHQKAGPITPIAIQNLAGFLEATNWGLVYGLNMRNDSPEQAAEEASLVFQTVGLRLIDLQIGNEPDLYSCDGRRETFEEYYEKWNKFANAIRVLHSNAPLAGPDTAHGVGWLAPFSEQVDGRVNLLTSHYYAEGPPSDSHMDIARLLRFDKRLADNIGTLRTITQRSDIPYRLTECNSCFHGGKPGVSDTFASALWGGDFMFRLTQAGFTGVNFHGGGNGCYSPIVGGIKSGFTARPIYYGMLMFSQLSGSRFIGSQLDAQGLNITAYAAIADNQEIRIAIFNKELTTAAHISLSGDQALSRARALWLKAPSVHSKTDVTLAGSQVSASGHWKPAHYGKLHHLKDKVIIELPAASAAVVIL